MATLKSITAPSSALSTEKIAHEVRLILAKLYRDMWEADVQVSLLKLESEGLIPSTIVNVDEMIRSCIRTADRNLIGILNNLNDLTEALGITSISEELRELDGGDGDGVTLTTAAEKAVARG